MKSRNKWTKEKLKQKLTEVYALETKENPIILYKDHPQIYRACRSYFSSAKEALECFGIHSINLRKNEKWSNEKIEQELLILLEKQNNGETFNFSKDYQSLKGACRRYFGTVAKAAQNFGLLDKLEFIRGETQHSWNNDPEEVIAFLQDLYSKKPDGYPYFYYKEKLVCRASERIFGSVKKALIAANIPLDWIKVYPSRYSNFNNNKNNSLKKSKILEKEIIAELKFLFIEEGLTLTQARKRNSNLFYVIDKQFENLTEALSQADIKHEDILDKNVRNAGILAEKKIVDALLTELGVAYSKGYNNKLRPDFVFKHSWGDAKISYYDKKGWDKTIKKYKPHTKQLLIIYIFGPDLGLHLVSSKVLATHINFYIKQLPKHRQIHYREQIEDIRQFYQSCEISNTDVLDLYTGFENEIQIEKSLGKITLQKGNYILSIQSETWQQSFLKLLDLPFNAL